MQTQENLLKQWLFLYSLAVEGATGAFLAIFIYVYNKIEWANSTTRLLDKYYLSLLILAGLITLILAPLYIFSNWIKDEALPAWYGAVKKNARWLMGFTLILYLLFLLHKNGIHFKAIELILALVIVYIFYSFQNALVAEGYPAWQNVATTLNLLLGVGKISLVSWIVIFHVYDLQVWITLFLLFELFVLFWRMKMLNRMRPETKQTVRFLLIQHSLLFGSRLIIGLFIPLMFTAYQWFVGGKVTGAIMLFVLFGEFLERLLFVFSAIPHYYDYEPE